MRKCLFAVFAGLLLMFSCTGNKVRQEVTTSADSVGADSVDTTEVVDTLELLITETPMPRAADAMFDDFIFNFVANKKLQKERIVFPLRRTEGGKTSQVDKGRWQMEHFFMRQGYYTLLFNDERQMELMKDTAVSEATVEKIFLDERRVEDYLFQRIRGAWMMTEVRVMPLEDNPNGSFLAFYERFVSDSTFQQSSLTPTVQFVGPDPDDDFNQMEGLITADTWEAFAPELPTGLLYNIVYGKPQHEGHEKIFLIRGVANGYELELHFKKSGDKWLLSKMIT